MRLSSLIRVAIFDALLAWAAVSPAVASAPWTPTLTRAHPVQNATFQRNAADNEVVDIAVALKLRHSSELATHVRSMTQEGNPEFRHWMGRRQFLDTYAPATDRAQAVADYLSGAGFAQVVVAPNRLLVTASGTAGAVRRAFNTRLAHYRRGSREGLVNADDAQIPQSLNDVVLSVLGLQTLDQMHPLSVRALQVQSGAGSVTGHNPLALAQIYDAASLPAATETAVGIITEGSMTQPLADLATFIADNGLPAMTPTVVTVGRASSDTSGTAEWDLDSQTILGMTGGRMKQLLLYTASSMSDASITRALNQAVSDNSAAVVNVSLGICESLAQSDGTLAADDQIFEAAVAQGQTISASTGDSGSSECKNAQGTAVAGALYPASSPYVVAVGGTTLSAQGGQYGSETAWSGTGGSPSLIEPKPTWQNGIGPPLSSSSYRGLPDLAFDADPNSGAQIVVNGATQQWGGTSLASPIFVGAWARIQTANHARLGFPLTWVYNYGVAGTAAYHDVTSGSNGDYSATLGWDYTTGFGSFDVAATAKLTQSSIAVGVSSTFIQTGQTLSLTATVTGNSPSGTVQFALNGGNIGSPVPLVDGVATLTLADLTVVGSDVFGATYSGDFNNAGAAVSTPVTVVVSADPNSADAPIPPWALVLLGASLFAVIGRARRAG